MIAVENHQAMIRANPNNGGRELAGLYDKGQESSKTLVTALQTGGDCSVTGCVRFYDRLNNLQALWSKHCLMKCRGATFPRKLRPLQKRWVRKESLPFRAFYRIAWRGKRPTIYIDGRLNAHSKNFIRHFGEQSLSACIPLLLTLTVQLHGQKFRCVNASFVLFGGSPKFLKLFQLRFFSGHFVRKE
jgi:hypothetical protein